MKNLTATICLTIAVLLGSAGVSWSADLDDGRTAYFIGDFATALKIFKSLAEHGDANAQYLLSKMYEQGDGVPATSETYLRWMKLAAEQGHPDAQSDLGWWFEVIEKDYKTAVKWYRLASLKGNTDAMLGLAKLYSSGKGVQQDNKTALQWFQLAAEQNAVGASSHLGKIFEHGIGTSQNYNTALKWYRLAASVGDLDARDYVQNLQIKIDEKNEYQARSKQGDAFAQYNLGMMYENGEGVPQDYKTAVKWYKLAAEQGNADAQRNLRILQKKVTEQIQRKKLHERAEQGDVFFQYNLGFMYSNGKGVLQDYKTALKWYKLAAEQGDNRAQYNLGQMFSEGNGVIQDDVYAHMWGNIAASNGNEGGGELRDLIAKEMTPSQLEKSQDLARECVRKKYKGC